MSFNFEQESCHDEFIILKQNQLLMDSTPIRFLYLEGYMALNPPFLAFGIIGGLFVLSNGEEKGRIPTFEKALPTKKEYENVGKWSFHQT